MKRKISILMICLMMASVTACGQEDAKAEDVSAEVKTEAEDTEPDVAVKDTKPDEIDKDVKVSGNLKADMTDFVLGTDIVIDDRGDFSLEVFPETHILLPFDDVRDVTEERNATSERLYEVTLKGGQKILLKANMNGGKGEFCAAGHIDRLELGRYAIDYNWCSVAVIDYKEQTAFCLLFSYVEYKEQLEYADEFKEFITDLTKENVDYLEEQISGWDNDFVAPKESTDGTETEVSDEQTEEITKTQRYTNIHSSEININYLSSEQAKLEAVDGMGYTYSLDLTHIDGDVWQAKDADKPDEIALTITFTEKGLFCDTEYEFYCNLYGDYVLAN